jgi:hypothetical protein
MTTDRHCLTKFRVPWTRHVISASCVTHSVTDNLLLDSGINFVVTEVSDAVHPFVGMSRRC